MESFKKTVFGGYRKNEVDAKMWTLEKRAEKAEADFAKAYANCEVLEQAAANLRAQLSDATQKNVELENQLQTAQNTPTADSAVIGKVYLHAYETGAEIAGTARDGAKDLWKKLDRSAQEEQVVVTEITQQFSAVGEEINKLIGQINQQTARLQDILNQFGEKISVIPSLYGRVGESHESAGKQFDAAIAEYEESAKTFLELLHRPAADPAAVEKAPAECPQPITENTVAPEQATNTEADQQAAVFEDAPPESGAKIIEFHA